MRWNPTARARQRKRALTRENECLRQCCVQKGNQIMHIAATFGTDRLFDERLRQIELAAYELKQRGLDGAR